MKTKNKITLSIIGIVTTLLIAIGLSYAYFSANLSGGEEATTITVTGGTMNIVYNGGTSINVANIIPSDNPVATKIFTVTGNNTTDIEMRYNLSLVVEENTFSEEALKYKLISINTNNNGAVVPSINELTNIGTGTKTILLGVGEFASPTSGNKVHTYNLEIHFPNQDYNQNEDQGKELKAHINIENYIPTLKDKILGVNNINVSTPLTEPGKEISSSNEAILAGAEDDYGTSYYYRGAVTNNYVLFADMCWRIVRVAGDGSVKLVLYNYNKGSNSCSETGASNAFARYNGDTYTTPFNTNYNSNTYVGFMYGTPDSSTYASEHANTNKSTILTNLETWYHINIAPYASNLADTIWCNDKSIDTKYIYGSILGYGVSQTGYGARGRLYADDTAATNAMPTLKCPDDINGGNLSKLTVSNSASGNGNLSYKIGLLTADEVAYAGGMYGTLNSTYYLNQNATDTHWWSMSPNNYNGSSSALAWLVHSTGRLGGYSVYYPYGLRPAVSLISTTYVTGEGTSSSPYVVQDKPMLRDKILAQGGGVSTIIAKGAPNFAAVALSTDSGLYATEDEYGTSYYYRGVRDLLNNNLIFGGFQWKIIRINGDGSIRIIYNGTEAEFTTNGTMNTTGTNTQINGMTYTWNDTYNDAKYVGYMFGGNNGVASITRNGTLSTAATYNETNSNVKTVLDAWYQTNLAGKSFENKIVDNLFCNDRQIQSEVGGGATGPGYGDTGTTTYYAPRYRLYDNKTPTLRCNLKNDRFTVNDIMMGNGSLSYSVGLINTDEAAMAGLVYLISNATSYLYTGESYWSFSPNSMYSAGYTRMQYVHSTGSITSDAVHSMLSLRPTISLTSIVTVAGDGSATNPFRVV